MEGDEGVDGGAHVDHRSQLVSLPEVGRSVQRHGELELAVLSCSVPEGAEIGKWY